ncbi:hypothetical protein KIN20_018647 [Parelaphostrongylus tenuis]|uniref:Uncharacterized protein n=1 Tax=Parelaphostrongylus tenuis TaxID=148309 RepID=A0AAD5N7S0_PARTN|nr:hypothetical protein KIN20_018647 [Parelaphostrongylus tenuis]
MEKLELIVLSHPPYGSNMAQLDSHLFPASRQRLLEENSKLQSAQNLSIFLNIVQFNTNYDCHIYTDELETTGPNRCWCGCRINLLNVHIQTDSALASA